MLLRVEDLAKHFVGDSRGWFKRRPVAIKAVDGVSFFVQTGEILGIVGESGSGKSTLARLILRLIEPTRGQVWLDGTDLTALDRGSLRALRPAIQMVFQDPYGSLNPRMSVGESVGYPLKVHERYKGAALRKRVIELLGRVGLSSIHADRLPHQLSGGQRQRAGIARAIALEPRLIVADEPVSALDLSTQAQVLNLIRELQADMHMAYIFITHDLAVAEYLCHRVLVMYAGRVVEIAPRESLAIQPMHPYTQALLSSALSVGGKAIADVPVLEGEPPSPADLPSGCKFHPRCPYAQQLCRVLEPRLTATGKNHFAACHLVNPEFSSQMHQS